MQRIIIPTIETLPDLSEKEEVLKIYPQLCASIKECARVYHNEASALISDGEYDQFILYLEACEERYPEIKQEDSPTDLVGYPATGELAVLAAMHNVPNDKPGPSKFFHEQKMLGLEKVHDEEDLTKWLNKVMLTLSTEHKNKKECAWIVESKVDGIAVKLIYEEGVLTHVALRGDGNVGDDLISDVNAWFEKGFKIKGLPQLLQVNQADAIFDGDYTTEVVVPPEYIEVIGEFVITKKDFDEVNALLTGNGRKPYPTPRHAAGGLVNARSFTYLTLLVHGIGEFTVTSKDVITFNDHREVLEWLMVTCKFRTVGSRKISMFGKNTIDEVLNELCLIRKRRSDNDVDIDGAVIKIDNFKQRKLFGETNKYPKWAIAFKYPSVISTTTIREIQWQVGRTGVLTPVAILDPVTISNVVYSRVTLNNPELINTLGLHRKDTVYIQRSGDVIPKVIGVVTERRVLGSHRFKIPEYCPECKEPVEMNGKRLFCLNRNCKGRELSILVYVVSKKVFDMRAIAVKTLNLLYQKNLVTRPEHLFQLTEEVLKDHYRSTENQRQTILKSIETARQKLTLKQVLLSLSIPNVSAIAVEEILWKFQTIDKLIQLADEAEFDQSVTSSISKIEKSAYWKSMMEYFRYPEVIESLKAFKQILTPTVIPTVIQISMTIKDLAPITDDETIE